MDLPGITWVSLSPVHKKDTPMWTRAHEAEGVPVLFLEVMVRDMSAQCTSHFLHPLLNPVLSQSLAANRFFD